MYTFHHSLYTSGNMLPSSSLRINPILYKLILMIVIVVNYTAVPEARLRALVYTRVLHQEGSSRNTTIMNNMLCLPGD